jgi:uncharacterized protein YajQ (UPF0234 family)
MLDADRAVSHNPQPCWVVPCLHRYNAPLTPCAPRSRDAAMHRTQQRRPIMPSFDIVSEVNKVELKNAVEQSNKEISTRFDFKNSDSRIEQKDLELTVYADDNFKMKQVMEVLHIKMAKRNVDVRSLDPQDPEKISGDKLKQLVKVREGLEQEVAKKIVKLVKDSKMKVQASIQGNAVRISGAKKDDLQNAINLVRKSVTEIPVQFNNFRD